MADKIVTILNWLLAIAMWLVIGRAVLDWLTRGHSTVIGRLFHFLTDPLYRPLRRLMPQAPPIAILLTFVLVIVALRVALIFVLSATS